MDVVLTPMAKVMAEKMASVETLVAMVKVELQELLESGLPSVDVLFFHTVFLRQGETEEAFLVKPIGNGNVRVDYASYEPAFEVKEGPLEGQVISIPMADGRDDVDE